MNADIPLVILYGDVSSCSQILLTLKGLIGIKQCVHRAGCRVLTFPGFLNFPQSLLSFVACSTIESAG